VDVYKTREEFRAVNKPAPKTEIVIKAYPATETITIYVSTSDMLMWIQTEAPQFGSLIQNKGAFILCVNPCYDTEEVAQYLRGIHS